MISAFPKIFCIGTDYIKDIFQDEVEVTSKIDGSQWVFGKVNGSLYMRSKGCIQYKEKFDNLFLEAVQTVARIEDRIPDNTIFYCEYLKNPKHNTLKYNRVPENHLMLFGVMQNQKFISDYSQLCYWAEELDIEVVPLVFKGKISSPDQLLSMLDEEEILGGSKREGVVVKNYNKPFLLGGQPIPIMAGKYVSEAFKEVHRKTWVGEHTGKGKWETFKESYKTEARWQKAIQRAKESGILTNSPKDIGQLLKSIQADIVAEEKQEIMNFLWKEFSREVLQAAVKGFPEWYKIELLKNGFQGE